MSDDHLKLIKEPIRNSFKFIDNETLQNNMDALNKHYQSEIDDIREIIENLKLILTGRNKNE